ncbi:arylsulfatase [Solitalea longa]|uniref:Arylsulfatase n=1 Tax=Solitalea longa TaxID=2079460 RepID=A0A2S4ZY29_9SPHI|nr:sulfatase [Solitalea longa]POY35254.1 arylsulfatase [Solitalea longa]
MKKIVVLLSAFLLIINSVHSQKKTSKPNFIVIFTDDLGYGDLGTYGNPSILTPNLDKLASEGQKWTNFYVAANVCTPSRAALMTGRLPVRIGMESDTRRVLFPNSSGGLPESETTIAELLKTASYQTAAIGKWHLGHLEPYTALNNGFDYYFGIPYSNDMDRVEKYEFENYFKPDFKDFNVPLIRNKEVIEQPANQETITKRYTEESVAFIKKNKDKPFFLYLAHTMPHIPLFTSKEFVGKSKGGKYGDVIEELDWSVGQIIKTLKEQGLDENTYVIFTSDNGPWKLFKDHGGSSGTLFGAKGTSYEGGTRVPFIIWSPKNLKPKVEVKIGSTLDLLATIGSLAHVSLPKDLKTDGYDLSPVLKGENSNPRNEMFFYHGTKLFAVRVGDYKLYYYKNNPIGYPEKLEKFEKLELFNLAIDPSETNNIIDKKPDIVAHIQDIVSKHQSTLVPVKSNIEAVITK